MSGRPGIREFALDQMNRLLTRLAFQVHRAAKTPGPDEIHDVRVSIRRFSQGLTLFADFFPPGDAKKIRRRLKRMMRLTSALRDRDIALDLLTRWKIVKRRPRLVKERLALQREFSALANRWSARDFSAKWRSGLALQNT